MSKEKIVLVGEEHTLKNLASNTGKEVAENLITTSLNMKYRDEAREFLITVVERIKEFLDSDKRANCECKDFDILPIDDEYEHKVCKKCGKEIKKIKQEKE